MYELQYYILHLKCRYCVFQDLLNLSYFVLLCIVPHYCTTAHVNLLEAETSLVFLPFFSASLADTSR